MERFWMVFKDQGHMCSSKRHYSREAAITEAKRLAGESPQFGFLVAAFTGHAQATAVTWTELERNRRGEESD